MKRRHHLTFYWFPVFIYCFLIFLQSSFPASESIPDLRFMDKLLHFFAYALLSAMILRALRRHYEGNRFALAMMLSIGLHPTIPTMKPNTTGFTRPSRAVWELSDLSAVLQ